MLVVIALMGLAFAWVHRAREQREAVAALVASNPGVTVRYDSMAPGQPAGRWARLRQRLGVDYVSSVEAIELHYATDAELRLVAKIPSLRELYLQRSVDVTDAGLTHLRGLTALRKLVLADAMMVGDTGLAHIAALQGLEDLQLQVGQRTTAAGIRKLAELRHLTRLEISCYSPDAAQAIGELRRLLPHCQIRQIGAGEYL